ncbi:unnamed protein product [Arabidopsis thaliana]|uniref:GTP-binding protein-like protein n=2 Tax=Arabidopsis thaliana TaxID=3702 RepID=Q9LIS0_ARATH|nr:GTP-binding protein-like protein [Arabidopsis thaliana]NP_001327822.1 GTP-binding protein-like protein [Arabidopsis thaliana]ANM65884.1 GTP-binding protein-like protein [Arabidopsis thaliana]ANM65885.1 GTP-binding protein-like protein [Arabidopsis thaliana]BAB03003.1 unnamed protein product [Arabidopsis thaliana]|eukprot:NP_001327821.1 GTP-binding protein-like protein [Arabidopsis thaliana]
MDKNKFKMVRCGTMEKNIFKKISAVVPTELDFDRAIRFEYQIPNCTLIPDRVCHDDISDIRQKYAVKVMSAGTTLSNKLNDVLHEFPCVRHLDPVYASLLHQRYNMYHYDRAVRQVSVTQTLVNVMSFNYVDLLRKDDDCDSRDKCRSLGVTALARMLTFAKSCIPALNLLDQVREFMASVEDDAAATSLVNKYSDVLPPEKYPFPDIVWEDETADFVDPETLLLVEELDRRYELWLKGGSHI